MQTLGYLPLSRARKPSPLFLRVRPYTAQKFFLYSFLFYRKLLERKKVPPLPTEIKDLFEGGFL